jgi:hypothetical protein
VLAYLATKKQFLIDAPDIQDIVKVAVKKNLNINVGQSEYNAWRNSLGNAMSHVVRESETPDDAAIAIEYRLNSRKFRIDFLISGKNAEGKESLLIIELKQWSEVAFSELSEHVKTFVGGGLRDERHPSYQAWSYASHLQQFNEYVYSNDLKVSACAYLHNCEPNTVIGDKRFADKLSKAPVFIKNQRFELQNLVNSKIKTGDGVEILRMVDSSPIRPSKQLAEAVGSMLDGNEEFVLLDEQKTVLEKILNASMRETNENKQVLIIHGGPGTGKSVISINALAKLSSLRKNVKYVTPNAAPRAVFESKLQETMSKFDIKELFSGAGAFAGIAKNSFDVLIVDEAHRLKLRGQWTKGGVNQIKEIIDASSTSVFFIDEAQKVTWKDIGEVASIEEFARNAGAEIEHLELTSQFRCGGSDDYMAWLDNALGVRIETDSYFSPGKFDFKIVASPEELRDVIAEKNKINNKSRVVAGYCWEWVSRKDDLLFDITFPEFNFEADWNLTAHGSAWIIHPESVKEIGCIHTCQGLELDYVGVIIGPDLKVQSGDLQTFPEARAKSDKSLNGFKKELLIDPISANDKADRIIRNTYRTLMTRGMKGCYVYFTDPDTAEYFRDLLPV